MNPSWRVPWHHTWCIKLHSTGTSLGRTYHGAFLGTTLGASLEPHIGLHISRIGRKLGFKQGATLALQSAFNRCNTLHRGGYTRRYTFIPHLEPYLALDLNLGAIMGIPQGTPYDHSWRHTHRLVSHLEPYLALSLALGAILGAQSHTSSHTWRKVSHLEPYLAHSITLGAILGETRKRHDWCFIG
jgi:hypothetical protein